MCHVYDGCSRFCLWAELPFITERYKCRAHMLSLHNFISENFPKSSKPTVYILTEISKFLKFSKKCIYTQLYIYSLTPVVGFLASNLVLFWKSTVTFLLLDTRDSPRGWGRRRQGYGGSIFCNLPLVGYMKSFKGILLNIGFNARYKPLYN